MFLYLKLVMIHKYISSDKIYYRNEQNNHIGIHDWSCDLINNKINTKINRFENERINSTVKSIVETKIEKPWSTLDYHIFENNKKIYIAVLTKRLCLDRSILIDLYVFEANNCDRIYEKSIATKKISTHNFNNFFFSVYYYGTETRIFIDVMNNQQEEIIDPFINIKGKLADNIYYGNNQKNPCILAMYTFLPNTRLKTIDLSQYGKIQNMCNLKEKICMIIQDNKQKYILIYDTKTNSISMDYSFGSECDTIEVYDMVLLISSLIYDNKTLQYKKNNRIFSLKPNIKKMKTFDLFFMFV